MKVMKFGGTSVGSASAIERTCGIIQSYVENGPIVTVVSAISGITNTLLATAEAASAGDSDVVENARLALLEPHRIALQELVPSGPLRLEVTTTLGSLVDDVARLLYSIYILQELTPRARDRLVSFGERMSSELVAACLTESGTLAEAVTADRVIVTDSVFGSAAPLLDKTALRAQATLLPLLESGKTPIVTGFFGADENGITTTLGRGGSDFSASILANALEADDVIIWTDVSGVMTADPRLVSDAQTVRSLSYAEATELAYFGATVIHPKTMYPASQLGIPIWIKNTFEPEQPGTQITDGVENSSESIAKAIASVSELAVLTVEGLGQIEVSDVTVRIFQAVGATGANVVMISQASSQHSVSFVVRNEDVVPVVEALEIEFEEDIRRQRILSIGVDQDLAIIAVVGAGMRGTPGVAGKVFGTMGANNINVVAIAQGSSELNISFAVSELDVGRAVSALHDAFVSPG